MGRKRFARASTQPLQLRMLRDITTDFAREDSTVPGVHRPAGDRYNVHTPRTTRATVRIPVQRLPDAVGVDDAYEYIIYEYGG